MIHLSFVQNRNLTDEVNEIIKAGAVDTSIATVIDDFIGEDKNSIIKKVMQKGVDYYHVHQDIEQKKRTYWVKGKEKTDESKPNNKLAHAWHTMLVDQKVAYLCSKPPSYSDKEATTDESDNKVNPNQEFLDYITEILDEDFEDDLNDLGTGASNKGVEWLHVYIDEVEEGIGELKYKVIDARECIPIWKSGDLKELQALIRYYEMQVNDDVVLKAEYWTDKQVYYYIQNGEGGDFIPDNITEDEPIQDHFTYNNIGYGWDRVPFIPWKNNKDMTSDLQLYKSLIDEYDKKVSVRGDDLEEIQEAVDILRGYDGTDLAEYQHNKRYYKVVKVNAEGGYDQATIDIPTDAHESHLNRLDEDITTFGQGVNPKSDKFGNNPSGVSIKFLYSALDLKASKMERKFQRAFNKLFWFISEYLYMTGKTNQRYNPSSIKVTFNKTMIANEVEMIDAVNKSKGVVDEQTIFESHPLVQDPSKALDRYRAENNTNLYGNSRVQQELNNMSNTNIKL